MCADGGTAVCGVDAGRNHRKSALGEGGGASDAEAGGGAGAEPWAACAGPLCAAL